MLVGQCDIPVGFAGMNGVMRVNVLKDNKAEGVETPLLIPINLQEALNTVVNLPKATMEVDHHSDSGCTRRDMPLRRLESGHRATSIMDFDPEGWYLPDGPYKDGCDGRDPFLAKSGGRSSQLCSLAAAGTATGQWSHTVLSVSGSYKSAVRSENASKQRHVYSTMGAQLSATGSQASLQDDSVTVSLGDQPSDMRVATGCLNDTLENRTTTGSPRQTGRYGSWA